MRLPPRYFWFPLFAVTSAVILPTILIMLIFAPFVLISYLASLTSQREKRRNESREIQFRREVDELIKQLNDDCESSQAKGENLSSDPKVPFEIFGGAQDGAIVYLYAGDKGYYSNEPNIYNNFKVTHFKERDSLFVCPANIYNNLHRDSS